MAKKKVAKRSYTKRAELSPAASNGFDMSAFDFTTEVVRGHGYDLRVTVNLAGQGQRYAAYFNQTCVVYQKQFTKVVIGSGTYDGKESLVVVFDSSYHKTENFTITDKYVSTGGAFCLKVVNFFGLSLDKLTEKFSATFRLVEIDKAKNAYLLEVISVTKHKGMQHEN